MAGTAGAGRMAPQASTRIPARMKRVQGLARFTRERVAETLAQDVVHCRDIPSDSERVVGTFLTISRNLHVVFRCREMFQGKFRR